MVDAAMHVDPVKLRQFAEDLADTLAYYRTALETLDGRLSRLSSSWRDQEFVAFAREVKTTRQLIEEFIREGLEAKQKLLEDADRAEVYQRVHLGNR